MPTFQTDKCKGFFEHWLSLPKDGLEPTSETFLDTANPNYAPFVYILEFSNNGLIIRLMGTALVERWKQDRTGQSFMINQDASVRKVFFENSANVVHVPCGLRATNRFKLGTGQRVSTEAITLPLATGPGRPERIVSFSQMFEHTSDKEAIGGWEGVVNHEWIDLGAGVPNEFKVSASRPDA